MRMDAVCRFIIRPTYPAPPNRCWAVGWRINPVMGATAVDSRENALRPSGSVSKHSLLTVLTARYAVVTRPAQCLALVAPWCSTRSADKSLAVIRLHTFS